MWKALYMTHPLKWRVCSIKKESRGSNVTKYCITIASHAYIFKRFNVYSAKACKYDGMYRVSYLIPVSINTTS